VFREIFADENTYFGVPVSDNRHFFQTLQAWKFL
jgi:hypothetical protein